MVRKFNRREVAALLPGALLAAKAKPARAQAPSVIKVGLIQPMSGNLSPYAQEGQPIIEYLFDRINNEGGIKSMGGAKLQAVLADDSSEPARAAIEARRLATQENVSVMMGTLLSSQMLGISPVVDEYKVPTIALWAGGAKADYLYSLGFPYDRGYAKSMADFARDTGKIKTAVVCCSDFSAGQVVSKFLQQMLATHGIKVLADVPLDIKAGDHTAAMLRIRSLKPDATIGLLQPRDGILLMQARYNLHYNDGIFIGNSPYSDVVIWRELGAEIGGAVLPNKVFGMASFSEGARIDAVQALLKELKDNAKLKSAIGQAAIQAAQGVRVLQLALEAAGSADREAIYKAIGQVQIPFGDKYLYLSRPDGLSFGQDRMPLDATSMMVQWTADQKHEVVWPSQYAEAKPRI
jgi:ABC-type branched-subunit amino acid transport system substrate-binding protein